MRYCLNSLRTLSYWKYALLTAESGQRILAAIGALYLVLEILDFFAVYPKDQHTLTTLFLMMAAAVVYTLFTRRPATRVSYKIPHKDFGYEVRIGDLLDSHGGIVISTNTTFDTDIAGGLINPSSLQAQLTRHYFDGRTDEIDEQIKASLGDMPSEKAISPGKKNRYPIGTVAKVRAHGKIFYMLAMADLNEHGTAQSTPDKIEAALDGLWRYVAERGELGDLYIPVLGTGRGRIQLPRKKGDHYSVLRQRLPR